MESLYRSIFFILLLAGTIVSGVLADVPRQISFQGQLLDDAGAVVADSSYEMEFSLYDLVTGGTALWTEFRTVVVHDGIFQVNLGAHTYLDLPFDRRYYLGMRVGNDPEMYPRLPLTSAAYALRAEIADALGGYSPTDFVQTGTPGSITAASSDAALTVSNTGGGPAVIVDGDLHASGTLMVGSNTKNLAVFTDGAVVDIKSNGAALGINYPGDSDTVINVGGSSVGIGNSSPAHKLDVTGAINTSEAYKIDGETALRAETFNLFAGFRSGENNSGSYNTFYGYHAGRNNTSGQRNTLVGNGSGENSGTGNDNTAMGHLAGNKTDSGEGNTFVGSNAGYANVVGDGNTFIGKDAGAQNDGGTGNTFLGYQAGTTYPGSSFILDENTFTGYQAGQNSSDGHANTFIGAHAGKNYTGINGYNTFVGVEAGISGTTCSGNTFIGQGAGGNTTVGGYNTFVGFGAGRQNTIGRRNLHLGQQAGYDVSSGDDNVFIGYRAGWNETGNNKLYIQQNGTSEVGGVVYRNPLVYGEFDTGRFQVGGDLYVKGSDGFDFANEEAPVYLGTVDNYIKGVHGFGVKIGTYAAGDVLAVRAASGYVGIGTNDPQQKLDVTGIIRCTDLVETSDARFKSNIEPISGALSGLEHIRGVRFQWNQMAESIGAVSGETRLGVIAQDVESVFPELVSTDAAGHKAVDYTKLTAVLIEAVKEQQRTIESLSDRISSLERMGEKDMSIALIQ